MRRLLIILALIALVAVARVSAQYASLDLQDAMRSLFWLPEKRAWLLTAAVPDDVRFCAARSTDGALIGCVTAKELRAKADAGRSARR